MDHFKDSVRLDHVENFPSVVDRFYDKYNYNYDNNKGKGSEPHLILVHSNGIVIVQLAPVHPAFEKNIIEISYDVGHIDRSYNKVKGKSKRGGLILQEKTQLAVVKCKDGSEYKVVSCLPGKLIEVNKNLTQNLDLMQKEGDGYIAIILPKHDLKIHTAKWEKIQSQMDFSLDL